MLLVLSQNLAAPAPTLHAHLSIDQSSSEAQPGSAVDPIDPKSKLTTILETEVEAVGGGWGRFMCVSLNCLFVFASMFVCF